MTQAQLDRAVARRTGESLRTIRRLGFHAQSGPADGLEPEDLPLAVDCPFCGPRSPLPARSGGVPAPAECGRCDVDLDHAPGDLDADPRDHAA